MAMPNMDQLRQMGGLVGGLSKTINYFLLDDLVFNSF